MIQFIPHMSPAEEKKEKEALDRASKKLRADPDYQRRLLERLEKTEINPIPERKKFFLSAYKYDFYLIPVSKRLDWEKAMIFGFILFPEYAKMIDRLSNLEFYLK